MTTLKSAASYDVGTNMFPAVSIDEWDLRQAIAEADFAPGSIVIESVDSDSPHRRYKGILLAQAIKTMRA